MSKKKEGGTRVDRSVVTIFAAFAALLHLSSSSLLPVTTTMPESFLMTTTRATVAAYAQVPSSESSNGCNCIVVRLDDVQTGWYRAVQAAVLERLIDEKVPTTLGLIMNAYDNNTYPPVTDKIREGVDSGLFELALHGWDHVDYTTLPLEVQSDTLAYSKTKIGDTLNATNVRVFITPFNVFNVDTLQAMQANDLDIISSVGNELEQLPNMTDAYGVIHLHQSINYGFTDRTTGEYTWSSSSQILAAINNSMEQKGYSVLTIHPQDFITYDASSGDRLDIPDQERIDNFISIIEQLRDVDGRMLVHFEDAVELLEGVELPDGVKPSVSITSPSPSSAAAGFVGRLGVPFTVEGTAADNVKVASVEVRASNAENTDGTSYELAITSDGFRHWSYDLTIPNAEYNVIRVRVTDTSGNQQWSTLTLNIEGTIISGIATPDTIAPSVEIISPELGARITMGKPFVVTGTASDNVAVASVEVRASNAENTDGASYELASSTIDGFATWNLEFTIPNAEYNVLRVRVTDTAGNQEEISININVISENIIDDEIPPTTMPPTRTITSHELVDEMQLGENLPVEEIVAAEDEDDSSALSLVLVGGIAGVMIILFFATFRFKLMQQN